jgi:DNA-binding response OmpR family regulator
VRAILRRIALDGQAQAGAGGEPAGGGGSEITMGASSAEMVVADILRVDPMTHTATLAGAELDLTPKEFELLLLFAGNPGRAFSREFLLERLWGYDYDGFDRTVDTHITRLRKKLGPLGEKIVTIWGVGYRFAV